MKNFMLGAAVAAHQVEGNNSNSDFWVLENLEHSMYAEPSLDAVDHYNRYEEDIDLLKEAGLNAFRFSIEWAKIESKEGVYDQEEINHYKKVLEYCHKQEITPIVTLHHFSSPKWLISNGGWQSENTVKSFEKYTEVIVKELGHLIPYICTINEANMPVQITRIMNDRMKNMSSSKSSDVQVGINLEKMQEAMIKLEKESFKAFNIENAQSKGFLGATTKEAVQVVLNSHVAARKAIKTINPNIQVGLTMSLYDYQAIDGAEDMIKELWYEDFHQFEKYIKEDDFFGVQNYTRKVYDKSGKVEYDENTRLTEMKNEYYPKALYNVLKYVSKYVKKPLIVTENGISTSNDQERVEFINDTMKYVEQAISENINLIGYMHWSLLDNFEWQLGYTQKFGLIEVDRKSQTRYPKQSLKTLGNYGSKLNEYFGNTN